MGSSGGGKTVLGRRGTRLWRSGEMALGNRGEGNDGLGAVGRGKTVLGSGRYQGKMALGVRGAGKSALVFRPCSSNVPRLPNRAVPVQGLARGLPGC